MEIRQRRSVEHEWEGLPLINRLPVVLRSSARSLLVRLAVAPLVALMSLSTAGIVVRELGADGYGLYSIIVGLAIILPFADLGVGAALMDATARARCLPDDIVGTAKRSIGVLFGVSICLAGIGWLAVPFDVWSLLLAGGKGDVDLECAVALSIFAIGLPFSLGIRILTGLELNYFAILFQSLSPTLGLSVTVIASLTGSGSLLMSSAPFIGMAVSNFAATAFALRQLGFTLLSAAVYIRSSGVESSSISRVAGPMLVITMALPVAYQFDRYILAHGSSIAEVSQYSLAYQLFAPLVGIVSSAAAALWPAFIKHSDENNPTRSLFLVMPIFGFLGALAGFGLVVFGAPVSRILSGGELVLRFDVLISFGLFLFLQSISYPLATFLTRPDELRIQAIWHVLMAGVNVVLTFLSVSLLGAAGPMSASFIAVLVLLFVPQLVLARKRRRHVVKDENP